MKISRIREFKNFCLATAILVAGASLASCSSSDDIAENNQQPVENPTAPKIYTMTIQASKGDGATTRGLYTSTTDGKTSLNVKWNEGEVVDVYQNNSKKGTLTAAASNNGSTTLTGEVSGLEDMDITFYLHSYDRDYTNQKGVLLKPEMGEDNSIETKYDFAQCTVAYNKISINGTTISVPGGIALASSQAIVKFMLKDKSNDADLNASELVVNVGTTDYTITPGSATNELYVAIPDISGQTVNLTATVGSDTYTYDKSGVTFTNGQYYEINVKMLKTKSINAGSVEVPAGEHWLIKGTVDVTSNQITIRNGATVTLDGVNIKRDNRNGGVDSYCIKCEGNATIILKDGSTNTLTSLNDMPGEHDYPALWVGNKVDNNVTTLTIKGETAGTGALTVQSGTNSYCAGIGSGVGKPCGHIVIEGGFITATGGAYAAGIGSGDACGNITIKGGTIEATGGNYAPGIGSGYKGSCGAITIASTVSSVTATKGDGAPYSIGAGEQAVSCGTVKYDDRVMYDGSAWTTTPEHGNSYGGLKFAVSKTVYDGDTWTLTP